MTNSQNKKIKDYYDENQSFYDIFWMNKNNLAMHYGYWGSNTKNRHEALLNENQYVTDALGIDSSDVVLDAGCGVGGTSISIAERYGSKVVGIGLVKKQNDSAVNNAKKRKVDSLVTFEEKDFNKTGFPDRSFTKIFAIESACHSENKQEFIKEAYRLLKPGGKLVVCDYFITNLKDKRDKKNYGIFCQGWAMANLSKKVDYETYLEKSGFVDVGFSNHTNLAIRSSRFMHRLALAWSPIDIILNLVKIVSDENLVSTKASISQYYLFRDGALMHGIFTATKPEKVK